MNANQQANELELLLDRSDSFGSPGYEDFELSSVLTAAQQLYVKKFISQLNNRKQQGFQETEIRKQGLSALIKKGTLLSPSASQVGVVSNGKLFDLPLDFMYSVYEEAIIDKLVCNTQDPIVAEVRVMGYNEISRLSENKYKKPYFQYYGKSMVWRTEFSRFTTGILNSAPATAKRHELITDGTFAVNGYTIIYLKNPLPIVVDRITSANVRNCELDESTHRVIIDIAADLMMQRVKEQKIQNIESLQDLE